MSHGYEPKTEFGRFVDSFEVTAIATMLGLMTIITFVNVVLRKLFNSSLIWSLEVVTFLFAWLVIFGVSYAVKVTAHLGVDAVTGALPARPRKALALVSAALCVVYAFLLLKGAWDYWANFANLPQTAGRWFPLGFEEMKRTSYRGWYEVNDIPMQDWLRWIEPLMNDGDEYEKIPRFIPYAILPVGMALLLFRFVQATIGIWKGERGSVIVSHEAEDAIKELEAGR